MNDSQNGIQFLEKTKQNELNIQTPNNISQNTSSINYINITNEAINFAVDNRFPPIKIYCETPLKTQDEGLLIVKAFSHHIEQKFKILNPKFNQPLGFDHFLIDKNGSLICFTKYIELFIYMCNIDNYPKCLNNVKITPVLPHKLPAENAIILKFIDNYISLEDIQSTVKENLKSVYIIEEMMGTRTYRSRHIRVDLLSKEEYNEIINKKKMVIDGQIFEVNEFLPAPKILICSKCNCPCRMRKHCKSNIEVCRRCGKDRNKGNDHKACEIKCHHCGDDHESTNYKCSTISKFRYELVQKLKSNMHLLPANIQIYVPKQLRNSNDSKILMNNQIETNQYQTQNDQSLNLNMMNYANSSNNDPLNSYQLNNSKKIVWNSDYLRLQNDLINLKNEYNKELNDIKIEQNKQLKQWNNLIQNSQLVHLQMKTQAEAITNLYEVLNETLTPTINSIQLITNIMTNSNKYITNINDKQENELIFMNLNDNFKTLKRRLHLLHDHYVKVNTLIVKGMDDILITVDES